MLAPLQLPPSSVTMSPAGAPPPATAPWPSSAVDPMVESLQSMFPAIDAEVLSILLENFDGDIERCVSALLDSSADDGADHARATQLEIDAEMAMRAQEEVDAELAGELARQMVQEAERRKQQEPASRAAAAVSGSAKTAASLLARVRSAGRRNRSDHSIRLLGTSSDEAAASDTAPEALWESQTPLYAPPFVPSPPDEVAVAPPPPPTMAPTSQGGQEGTQRYTARVDRARAANQAKQVRAGEISPPTALLVPLPPVAAPSEEAIGPAVGILI